MLEIITHLLFFHLLFFRTIVFNRCWTWRGAYRPRKYSAEMAEKLCFTGKTARLQSETRTYITIQEGFGSEARKLIVCGYGRSKFSQVLLGTIPGKVHSEMSWIFIPIPREEVTCVDIIMCCNQTGT